MRRTFLRNVGLAAVIAAAIVSPAVPAQASPVQITVHAELVSAPTPGVPSRQLGTVEMSQIVEGASAGAVAVTIHASGLAPGFHGFHVHSVGVCEGSTASPFTSAGGHWNPDGSGHGAHVGDMPPLYANADGTVDERFTTGSFNLSQLQDADGSAVIVHATADNFANIPARYSFSNPDGTTGTGPDATTLATGDSGGRVACGVVQSGNAGTARPTSTAFARAELTSAAGGAAGFTRIDEVAGRMRVVVSATGLSPGFHGFHVHAVGNCVGTTTPAFTSAGGHLNTGGAGHGSHDGDLPSLLARPDGTATAEFDIDRLTAAKIFDADGSAVVVHAAPDNFANIPTRYRFTNADGSTGTGPDSTTLATGDSGGRVLCGVLRVPIGTFTPITPTRMRNTLTGVGGPAGRVGPGQSIDVNVRAPGVPSGVSSILCTITVTGPTATTHVTAHAAGEPRPPTSNLNTTAGKTVAATVISKISADGRLRVFNAAGSTHVIVDVLGWFSNGDTAAGSRYRPVTPAALRQNPPGSLAPDQLLGPDTTVSYIASGVAGVPTSGVRAVALTIAVNTTTASSFLTAFASGTPRPPTSNLNWSAGRRVTSTVIVPVGADGKVSLYNRAGTASQTVSVVGYFTPDTNDGGRFMPLAASRLRNTVTSGTPLGASATMTVPVGGLGGVPASGVTAVVLTVTATRATAPSEVTVWPAGATRPGFANLAFAAGETAANTVIVPLGTGDAVSLHNAAGSTHLIVDVVGFFAASP